MTRLLVSVRSGEEARIALEAGTRLIDVKEPSRGSLGAADSPVVDEIARVLPDDAILSAADGELVDRIPSGGRPPASPAWPGQVRFAKIGLARAERRPEWREHWRVWSELLPAATQPVAVIYADWQAAEAPRPREILDLAEAWSWPAVLIDTWDKTTGSLFDIFPEHELTELVNTIRARSLGLVLGGSLAPDLLLRALAYAPDIIAVRTAACRRSRQGSLEGRRVRDLLQAVEGVSASAAPVAWFDARD